MVRRFGVLGSAGVLLASVFVSVATLGVSAHGASFEDWAVVSAGSRHTCGVRSNGKLYCWGTGETGRLGLDLHGDADAPRRVGTFEDWATVSAGGEHTCGVRKNGKLYCWGSDEYGQIGDGGAPAAPDTPKRIGTFQDWVTVSAGDQNTCGVRRNGKLYCWGRDGDGQIGNGGENSNAATPVRIGTFEDWSTVSTGYAHTCGVRKNGKLYCWGSDTFGQLGDGADYNPADTPRRIGSFEDWATVSADEKHTCGVRKNGKLYCWGSDQYGQVGDGGDASEPVTAPRRIGSFEDWSTVSAGLAHTCGVRRNGKLYCWGVNYYGEVGDGSATGSEVPITSPVRIGTFEDWVTVSGGRTHTCGTRATHELYCWGSDELGQVGDGEENSTAVATPRRI